MQSGQGCGEPFVVPGQAWKACCPSEVWLDDPAARQQHKATFDLGMFDHLQLDAVFLRGLRGRFSCIALIYISQFHMFAGDLLHGFGQPAHPCAALLVGRRTVQRQRVPSVSPPASNFGPLRRLAPS